jgi:hypothetical protein
MSFVFAFLYRVKQPFESLGSAVSQGMQQPATTVNNFEVAQLRVQAPSPSGRRVIEIKQSKRLDL